MTNSERCISRVRAAVPSPGAARADWAIAVDVARRLERRLAPLRVAGQEDRSMFDYATPEAVWNEHRESTRGRDLDITGLSYDSLDTPQPWPFASGAAQGSARLYTDGRFATADGRARFVAVAWRGPAEPRDARFPISLNTGRLRDQWHGMSRTGTLGRLFAHSSEPQLQMHPQELQRRHWAEGDLVQISSRRGSLVLPVAASTEVAPAQAFIAMHWGSEYLAGLGVNALTSPAVCPQSQQPELKHAAVRIERAALPWQISAAVWLPADQLLARRETLRGFFDEFDYAHCVPFGRETEGAGPGRLGLRFRAALPAAASEALMMRLSDALGLAGRPLLHYADRRSSQQRLMALAADGTLDGFLLAGNIAADAWVLPLLQQAQPAAALGRALLTGGAQPPRSLPPASRQICACHDVSGVRIQAALAKGSGDADERLRQLQQTLRCGTDCGSCLPALRNLVQLHASQPVAG